MKTLVERGDTSNIKLFDRAVMELSPYMTPIEIDKTVGFMDRIQGSKWDINPSEEDSITQLKLILGADRYTELKLAWSLDNQRLIDGLPEARTKYRHKATGQLFDGLDETDSIDDYEKIKI
jgi:hypothetical protein